MVEVLPSYVAGAWATPDAEGKTVCDAVTGEPIVRVTSDGIDTSLMLAHAREVGGPALRRLTFGGRAALIGSLAKHLSERKDEIYALAARTGSTTKDAAFDIEGALNVLFVHASKGKVELPDSNVLLDGEVERVSKRGTFQAQHLLVPLRGVAVHINAYNFPVWGMLEKLAPSIVSGVPAIVKPATTTAFVAKAVFEQIIDSGILPEGSVQLLCGSVGDLLDHLTGQDVVAFTGSSATAEQIRSHPAVVARSVRVNAETDSLNSIILGPDAAPGTPEFDLFTTEVAREMAHKTGQKCTAIRRAFVPREHVSAAVEALRDSLSKVRVGDPADPEVTMGPLGSLAHREDVRSAVRQLTDAAEIVFGDLDKFEVTGADIDAGGFLPPILLRCDDPTRPEPHEIEPFGPVCTLLPYDSLDDAAELVARGQGSLVSTVVTHDPAVARQLVLDIASFHGRLQVLDRDDAKESSKHGAVLAQLVHGGPGRAGGGEELGGLRGLSRYLQRTAIQASPDMLVAISDRWVAGAQRHIEDVHPFRKYLEDLRLGDAVHAGTRRVTLEDIEQFADLTGDHFYAHTDEEAAKANPFFDGRVAHGYLVAALGAGLFVDPAPGPVLANYGLDEMRFLKPVYPGDELTMTLTAKEIRPRKTYGEVSWDADLVNQDGETVAKYDVLTMVAKKPAE
jgi:oxepin-CoA hydrolase/3-oxo-5,6-dehydrosuberyl-CoA semialdehyde dehydrogenase